MPPNNSYERNSTRNGRERENEHFGNCIAPHLWPFNRTCRSSMYMHKWASILADQAIDILQCFSQSPLTRSSANIWQLERKKNEQFAARMYAVLSNKPTCLRSRIRSAGPSIFPSYVTESHKMLLILLTKSTTKTHTHKHRHFGNATEKKKLRRHCPIGWVC